MSGNEASHILDVMGTGHDPLRLTVTGRMLENGGRQQRHQVSTEHRGTVDLIIHFTCRVFLFFGFSPSDATRCEGTPHRDAHAKQYGKGTTDVLLRLFPYSFATQSLFLAPR